MRKRLHTCMMIAVPVRSTAIPVRAQGWNKSSPDKAIEISDATGLANIRNDVTNQLAKYYKLTKDLDLMDIDNWAFGDKTKLPQVNTTSGTLISGQTASKPRTEYLKEAVITINDQKGLADIKDKLSGSYKLGKDIPLSGTWKPLGDSKTPFTGTLDGCGFTISGLNVSMTNTDGTNAGPFGYISGTAISVTWSKIGADALDGADLTTANFIDSNDAFAGDWTSAGNWTFDAARTNLPTLQTTDLAVNKPVGIQTSRTRLDCLGIVMIDTEVSYNSDKHDGKDIFISGPAGHFNMNATVTSAAFKTGTSSSTQATQLYQLNLVATESNNQAVTLPRSIYFINSTHITYKVSL